MVGYKINWIKITLLYHKVGNIMVDIIGVSKIWLVEEVNCVLNSLIISCQVILGLGLC